jgi:hypothetical protein
MQTKPGYGETLPTLLQRRFGIPERRTLIGFGVLVALIVVAVLLLRDPLGGRTQAVHEARPVFNTLYRAGLVTPAKPRPGELQRFTARQGPVRLTMTVRTLRLPAYRGDVAGLLPVYAERHIARLSSAIPGFAATSEGKARVQGAPGYEINYRTAHGATGRDVIVVPPDEPGVRDGLLVSLRQTGRTQGRAAAIKVVTAMRSTVRSLKFGADRDD